MTTKARRTLRAGILTLAAIVAVVCLMLGTVFIRSGWYGLNFFSRGAFVWTPVTPTDARLSRSIRLALGDDPPVASPGPLSWTKRADGFETAELSAFAGGEEVDKILLARLDPEKYRFQIHNRSAGDRKLGDWMRALDASLVVNGSYFDGKGRPATPLVSHGFASGPQEYHAANRALIVSDDLVGIRDLHRENWKDLFNTARYALVSYPLLVAPEHYPVKSGARWLANRTFVGQDSSGLIILGTTSDAFFSLERLPRFLNEAPLDLVLALNLDGGPVACQGISIPGYSRDFCGQWELNHEDGKLRVLSSMIGQRRVGLPIVLAAFPR
jgi:Phosphodiester glycosidase